MNHLVRRSCVFNGRVFDESSVKTTHDAICSADRNHRIQQILGIQFITEPCNSIWRRNSPVSSVIHLTSTWETLCQCIIHSQHCIRHPIRQQDKRDIAKCDILLLLVAVFPRHLVWSRMNEPKSYFDVGFGRGGDYSTAEIICIFLPPLPQKDMQEHQSPMQY